jgi:hypothetical protein
VPSGATTGPINITTTRGTVTTPVPYTILVGSGTSCGQ